MSLRPTRMKRSLASRGPSSASPLGCGSSCAASTSRYRPARDLHAHERNSLMFRSMPVTILFTLTSLCTLCGAGARADALPRVVGELPASVSAQIGDIQSKPAYAHTSWGMRVVDLDTGAVLIDQAGDRSMTPGSIMKVYST